MTDEAKDFESVLNDPITKELAEIISGWSVIKLATTPKDDPEWREHLATAMYVRQFLAQYQQYAPPPAKQVDAPRLQRIARMIDSTKVFPSDDVALHILQGLEGELHPDPWRPVAT